jgi:uncharacterized protein YggE
VGAIAASLAFAITPARAELAEGRIVSVGESELFVPADFAVITVGVTTQAATVNEASAQNAARMTRVVVALRDLGISEADIKTVDYGVQPRYAPRRTADYDPDALRPITGYAVTNSVKVIIYDMRKASDVIDRALAAGANAATDIDFGVKDRTRHLDRARIAAVENARHKAEVYARAARLELGRALVVTESELRSGVTNVEDIVNQLPQAFAAQDASPRTLILPGHVRITARVTVVYAVR